jgi:single-strand DNA-binding protein
MSDNSVTIVGNMADSPELRFTPNGIAVASIRLAVTPRIRERDGWKDGEPSFFRVNVWRDLAEHVADSLSKGDRAVVVGRLRTRSWETSKGDKRSVVEVEAEEIGPSLRFATAKPQRTRELATATQPTSAW